MSIPHGRYQVTAMAVLYHLLRDTVVITRP
jgi:hypothetical protein